MGSKERLLSLRHKLVKAAGSESLEQLARSGFSGEDGGFESLESAGPVPDSIPFGNETEVLKKAREGEFENISAREANQLEAIVEREFRQVSLITGNTFKDLPFPWEHYNSGPIRERINAVIPSIGRVEMISPGGLRTELVGTGFIVGDRLLMTNRHVAEVFVRGAGSQRLFFRPGRAAVDFGREHGFSATDLNGTLSFKGVRMVHPYWDMALFELESLPAGMKPCPLSVLAPEELVRREIATIGYPGPGRDLSREAQELEALNFNGIYGVKRLAPGEIDGRGDTFSFRHPVSAMAHDCSTLAGNSGSAIIDTTTGHVVGLHFKGITLEANFSVPLYELARDRRVIDAGVLFAGRVPPSTGEWEPWWQNPAHLESAATLVKPRPVTVPGFSAPAVPARPPAAGGALVSKPADGAVGVGAGGGGAAWTVPITVSVTVGAAVPEGVGGVAVAVAVSAAAGAGNL